MASIVHYSSRASVRAPDRYCMEYQTCFLLLTWRGGGSVFFLFLFYLSFLFSALSVPTYQKLRLPQPGTPQILAKTILPSHLNQQATSPSQSGLGFVSRLYRWDSYHPHMVAPGRPLQRKKERGKTCYCVVCPPSVDQQWTDVQSSIVGNSPTPSHSIHTSSYPP